MQNFTANAVVVHNPHISEVSKKWVVADLTTSRKDKVDGKIVKSEWIDVKFVDDCFELAKNLKSGDVIDILDAVQTFEKEEKINKYVLRQSVLSFRYSESTR